MIEVQQTFTQTYIYNVKTLTSLASIELGIVKPLKWTNNHRSSASVNYQAKKERLMKSVRTIKWSDIFMVACRYTSDIVTRDRGILLQVYGLYGLHMLLRQNIKTPVTHLHFLCSHAMRKYSWKEIDVDWLPELLLNEGMMGIVLMCIGLAGQNQNWSSSLNCMTIHCIVFE